MAMELSNKNWKLSFSDGVKVRLVNVAAGDQQGLQAAVEKARVKLGLSSAAVVYSCYEAGRDGFWIDRFLRKLGIRNLVVDPSSIEVNRRRRQVKTDRLDAEKLVRMLMRYWLQGERKLWGVVAIPAEGQEDARREHRELERLKGERTAHLNRLRGLLVLHGVRVASVEGMEVRQLRDWEGRALGAHLIEELQREQQRLELVNQQIAELEKVRAECVKKPATAAERRVCRLLKLKGLGPVGAWTLVREFFGWRAYRNRRAVGSLAGLTGTPYSSGDERRDQGISKAGNRRVRALMIEMAWNWVRFQPQSELARWYAKRFATGGGRLRRIGIVAVARKLLIALWKYLERDELPAGAIAR